MSEASCDLMDALTSGIVTVGNPYHTASVVCALVTVLVFVVSSITKNYSQVDKIWSLTPIIFCWIAVCDTRTLIMAVLITIWGLRLTYNFHRRGGYQWPPWKGEEDYRWKEIPKILTFTRHPVMWVVFNLIFISIYQNVLLLLITAPSFVAHTAVTDCSSSSSLTTLDYIATILVLAAIVIESMADNQQLAFQTEKYARRHNANAKFQGEYADGFKQSDLFAIVRKPNYAAEQSIWICLWLFSVAASKSWTNWSCVGWILLCMLFQGSGWITEKLTSAKYPKYKEYMKRVPLYVPNPLMLFDGGDEKSKMN